MTDIVGRRAVEVVRHLLVQTVIVANFVRMTEAQVHSPVFRAVEMQATATSLGKMVSGDFYGRSSVAAISQTEKEIYFFEPDSMENLILTNVVSLPDTPIAISKGQEVVIDPSNHEKRFDKIAVLMSQHSVALVSFGKDGRPVVSQTAPTDAYTTDVGTADIETDGKLDIITFGKFCLGVSVARNMGDGELQEAQLLQGPLGSLPFSSIAFTDFNGDLVPDMAALDWVNRRLLIFYGRGDGTYAQPVAFQLKAEPSTISVVDLTGNGYPDILVGYARLNQIDLFRGDGVGRFILKQSLRTEGPVSKFAFADFTGDGATDIAAFSSKEKQVTFFSYDLTSKNFKYAGAIGAGENFDDLVPFYFPGRFRADLVASSPVERYLKVFKPAETFSKSPDIHLPVAAESRFLTVCGNDTSNYVLTANSNGIVVETHYSGTNAKDADTTYEFQAEGQPASMRLIAPGRSVLLLSYMNADMVSVFSPLEGTRSTRKVMTAYLPFAVDGSTNSDTAMIAAAYTAASDSGVGISFFTPSPSGHGDFIEKDYFVREPSDYLSSAVSVNGQSFSRVRKLGEDSLVFVSTSFGQDKIVSDSVRGSNSKLLNVALPEVKNAQTGLEKTLLLTETNDTLTIFDVTVGKPMTRPLHQMCMIPFDASDFSSIRISLADSAFYVAFFDSAQSTVSLYWGTESQTRLIRSWHQERRPEDIAILPVSRRIYLLNEIESYVTVHNF